MIFTAQRFCIFSLKLQISIAIVYIYCMLIFSLQSYSYITNANFYCKRMFLLQAHIFIVSAYFHCKHRKICHALLNISHAVQNVPHGPAGIGNRDGDVQTPCTTRKRKPLHERQDGFVIAENE